jgi:hypothetical protein
MQVLRNFINDDEDTLFYKTKIPFLKRLLMYRIVINCKGNFPMKYLDIMIF